VRVRQSALVDNEDGVKQPSGAWVRQRLLNIWADDLSMQALFDHLDRCGGVVFTVNPDHLVHLQHNAEFLAAYRQADVVTVDSMYVKLCLSWLGRPVRHRLPGSDIVPQYCRHHAANASVKVFLLGAMPGVAAKARERLNAAIGREVVVGAHGPSMNIAHDAQETEQVIEMIRASGANALMVGFGAPKQEVWIARNRHRLPTVRVFMGIGATIDYEAGVVKRAPKWLRPIGLEWSYRVLTEPRRYLLRYAKNTKFFWWILLDWLGWYRDPLLRR
jgi:N-acetylglucosaminyldiphosphoundecaprenol N-acetyl-beta-D-mannosaminyltransferase